MEDRKKMEEKNSFWAGLRKYFFTGIATILPLFITFYIIFIVFSIADKISGRYVNSYLFQHYGYTIPGLGLIVTVLIIIGIGIISSHFIGARLFSLFERIFLRLPIVAQVYPSAKQLSSFFFNRDPKSGFRTVVLIPYPYQDSYAIGFITSSEINEFREKTGKELVSVFVPYAPTPFSGIIVLVPREKVVTLDISVEDAIKYIVSGGVVTPLPSKYNRQYES